MKSFEYTISGLVGALIAALIQQLIIADNQPEIVYGKPYKVTEGFYKDCAGYATALVGDDIMLSPMFCRNNDRFSSTFIPAKHLIEIELQ